MKIQDILDVLEAWAPRAYAEDFDNTGLLVGDAHQECTGALITLDTLPETISEAQAQGCNLIISFHPIIFKGLKRLTGANYVEQTVVEAIRNNVCIYALHTALDNHWEGVSYGIAQRLQLEHPKILVPQNNTLKKLTTYVPQSQAADLLEALYQAGAGQIGAYDRCSFSAQGVGSFRGNDTTSPQIGQAGQDEQVAETQLQLVYKKHREGAVLKALFNQHPYEEVAYEITAIEVAVLGGSGSFAIAQAKYHGADAYLTADLKYHDFFQGNDHFLLADIGHYESEQFTKNLILDFLNKKIPNFAFALARSTNPVNYF